MAFMDLPVPNLIIDLGSLIVLAAVVAGLAYRARGGAFKRFDRWAVLSSAGGAEQSPSSGIALMSFFTVLFRDVFTTRVLAACDRLKRASHIALFWGFVLLAISTTLAFLTNPEDAILPFTNPVKLFGNAGGILVVLGFAFMFYVRYREHTPIWRLTRSDFFILTLLLTVVTGFATQQAVYSAAGPWIGGAFWVHMAFVVVLLATAPSTKFFHALSKPVSILHDEFDARLGKEPVLPATPKGLKEGERS